MILQMFPKSLTIFGSDDNRTRQRNIELFQNDPSYQIIICSIKAAGIGITLTASFIVVHVELPWHDADLDQDESRVHRIGQKNHVQSIIFIGSGTIDNWIYYSVIAKKREIAGQITGSNNIEDEAIKYLSDQLHI